MLLFNGLQPVLWGIETQDLTDSQSGAVESIKGV